MSILKPPIHEIKFRGTHTQYRTQIQKLQILHKTHRVPLEQFEIYKHHKTHKNKKLNDQITFSDHIMYITQYKPPPQIPFPTHHSISNLE